MREPFAARVPGNRRGGGSGFSASVLRVLLFSCFLHAAFAEAPPFDRRYYHIEARCAVMGEAVVVIELRPAEGFSLNGEGYPPLVVEITQPAFEGAAARFSVPGVKEKNAAFFRLEMRGPPKVPVRLSGRIRLVACGGNLCRSIDETFEIDAE